MKTVHKIFLLLISGSMMLFFNGCTDPNAILDQSTSINNYNWSYANKIRYAVKIDDPSISYNLHINLRVTGDYRYSNIFVLLRRNGPGLKGITRFEVALADKDGEWYGKGSGNLYSYQVPLITNFKFPAKGTYEFEIEQNMRDNPLHNVSDVGIRVEKAR